MWQEKKFSPRTYEQKKSELQKLNEEEKEDLSQAKQELEKGYNRVVESIKKTQRDLELAKRYAKPGTEKEQLVEQLLNSN